MTLTEEEQAFGEPVEWLRTPEVIDRWIDCLTELVNSLAEQQRTANAEDELDRARSIEGHITRVEYAQRRKERDGWRRRAWPPRSSLSRMTWCCGRR